MIELLAPAKNKICAKAAIDYGADAIYIGASEFGARKNVPNSIEDIKEIVEYAHRFNVKVYVTINTILKDDEIKKADIIVCPDVSKMEWKSLLKQDSKINGIDCGIQVMEKKMSQLKILMKKDSIQNFFSRILKGH